MKTKPKLEKYLKDCKPAIEIIKERIPKEELEKKGSIKEIVLGTVNTYSCAGEDTVSDNAAIVYSYQNTGLAESYRASHLELRHKATEIELEEDDKKLLFLLKEFDDLHRTFLAKHKEVLEFAKQSLTKTPDYIR